MQWKRIIIDGQNMAHVFRHVYESLGSRKGIPTGVVYGFINLISRLQESFIPDEIIVAWDCVGPSAREIVNTEYKSARRNKELTTSEKKRLKLFYEIEVPMLRDFLDKVGIPQLQYKLLEADDIIGLCVSNPLDTSEWIIVSNDKDYIQWVKHGRCRLYAPSSDYVFFQEKNYTVHGGKTEFGLSLPSPETYAVWRAMIGDKSDSISGIVGVGPGTVYDVFRNVPPIHDLSDPQHIIKYIRKGEYSNARSKLIEEIAVTNGPARKAFLSTLTMMRPTPDNLNSLLDDARKISGVSSKSTRHFINGGVSYTPAGQGLPVFLHNIKRDPNAFVSFLRKLSFDIAYNRNVWYPAIRSLERLYFRRTQWPKYTTWSPCAG